MTHNVNTGLYTCPFCGMNSSIDYGTSCGCLYDDVPTTTSDTDFFNLVDWYPVEGKDFIFGYCDDADIVAAIKNTFNTTSDGSDYFTFIKDNTEYRLYF